MRPSLPASSTYLGAMAVEVMEILQAINLRGTTVVIATHDVGLMDRFPYRRLRFVDGKLVVGGIQPRSKA